MTDEELSRGGVTGAASDRHHRPQALRESEAHKRTEEALRTSEARLRLLMEQSPFGIQIFDPDGTLVQVNRAWETMWGARAEDVVGRFNALHDPQLEAMGLKHFVERVFAGEPMAFQDVHYDPARSNMPGRGRWLRAHSYHLYDRDGQIQHIVLLNEDITERKTAERDREKLIEKLEAKNAELERFTYTVSHDLKSPLVTIRGFLTLLEEDALAGNVEQMKEDIAHINEAVGKMQRLLGELLELSRIGRLMNPPVSASLSALAREAVALVEGPLRERGIAVEIAPDMPVVSGDRVLLLQVFQNLVDNAVKFMGAQAAPRITIDADVRDGEVICAVRDNGMGIAPHHHDRIFGLFERLHPRVEGTGIGLALVKRIVDVHGGRVWVVSDGEQRGSTFYVALPLPDAQPDG